MAVYSIHRTPVLQVQENKDARDERDRLRQPKKDQKDKDPRAPLKNSEPEKENSTNGDTEMGQILDTAKTIELLQLKPVEPKTLRKHAFEGMTRSMNVKKTAIKKSGKLNKSA